MTSEQLHKMHVARPFDPFTIHLADGRQVRVNHPEVLAHAPGTRIAVVALPNDSTEIIDLLLITSIVTGNGDRRRGRHRASS